MACARAGGAGACAPRQRHRRGAQTGAGLESESVCVRGVGGRADGRAGGRAALPPPLALCAPATTPPLFGSAKLTCRGRDEEDFFALNRLAPLAGVVRSNVMVAGHALQEEEVRGGVWRPACRLLSTSLPSCLPAATKPRQRTSAGR